MVSLVFLFTSFGLPEALTQIIIKNPEKQKSVIRYLLLPLTIATVLFLTISIIITSYTQLNPNIKYFNFAFVLYILTYTFHYITYSILRGHKRFESASWYSLLNRVIFIFFIITLFFFRAEFIYVLGSMSLALIIAGALPLKKIKKISTDIHEKIELKHFLYLAFSLFLMQVSFYSLRFIDALVIKYLLDFTQLGLYSAYASVTNVIRLLGYVFPMVVVPMAAVSRYKLRESFRKILKLLIPFALVVLGATYILVPLLYGAEYKAPYLPLALVISSTLLIIYSYFNSVFVGENKFSTLYLKIISADVLISLLINTGLNFILIMHLGIIGAPIATAITLVIKIMLNLYGIKRLRKPSPSDIPSLPSQDHISQ